MIQNIRNFKQKNRILNLNRNIDRNNHNQIISPNRSTLNARFSLCLVWSDFFVSGLPLAQSSMLYMSPEQFSWDSTLPFYYLHFPAASQPASFPQLQFGALFLFFSACIVTEFSHLVSHGEINMFPHCCVRVGAFVAGCLGRLSRRDNVLHPGPANGIVGKAVTNRPHKMQNGYNLTTGEWWCLLCSVLLIGPSVYP